MEILLDFLQEHAQGDLLPWGAQMSAAERFGVTCAQVEEAALEAGLLPARYQRNRTTISLDGQRALFRSRVAVIGCGGLGGYILEQLARLGVGHITAIDPDLFEEHNLNRQLLATPATLGKAKVEAARQRVNDINPAVTVTAVQTALGAENGRDLLCSIDLAIDALDSISVRLELAEICRQVDIPLVHGAIGGWYGHVVTQFPGERSLEYIYRNWKDGKGIEQRWGNPAFTPAVVASLEVAEACKVLLGEGVPLRNRELIVDLHSMDFHAIAVDGAGESSDIREC